MNPRLENISKLPLLHRILILSGILLLVVGGFAYLLLLPRYEELKSLQEKNDQLATKIEQDRGIVKNLPQFKAEYEKMNTRLEQALTELPNEKEIPALLTSIAAVAKENGLDVLRFKPGNETRKGFYAEVPVELKLTGSYHQAGLFFEEVSNLSRIVNINNLSMGNAKSADGKTDLSVDCLAVTFRFVEEPVEQKGKPAPKGKK